MPDDALTIEFDFRHILCPSRAFSFCFGTFPCLGLRRSLKTANFAFWEFDDEYCGWPRLRERVCFLVENRANNI